MTVKRAIHQARIRLESGSLEQEEHVVERLRRRLQEARAQGNVVRTEWLDGQQPSWCELRGVRTIILDASQTATDQLRQLEEILGEIASDDLGVDCFPGGENRPQWRAVEPAKPGIIKAA